jgi:hypothetical protein
MSHQQRKYYFSVIVPEVQRALYHAGIQKTREETDDMLRDLFLSHQEYDEDTDTWTKTRRRMSLAETDISAREFNQFVNFVVQWAIEILDWALPYPNEIFTFKDFSKSQIESLHSKPKKREKNAV